MPHPRHPPLRLPASALGCVIRHTALAQRSLTRRAEPRGAWARPARCGPPAPRSSSSSRCDADRGDSSSAEAPRRSRSATPDPSCGGVCPTATLAVNLSAAGMVGALVTALFTLKAGEREFDAALDMASISAARLHRRGRATGFLTFVNTFNPAVGLGPEFGAQLGRFLVETESGRTWLHHGRRGCRDHGAGLRGAVMDADAVRRDPRDRRTRADGHAGALRRGGEPRRRRDGARAAHHRRGRLARRAAAHGRGAATHRPRPALATAMSRYSSIALAAFIVVAISGTVRATIGVGAWENLASPYGAILLVKVGALIALGVLGAWYRRRLIGRTAARMRHPAASGGSSLSSSASWAWPAAQRRPSPAPLRRRPRTSRRCARPRSTSPAPRCRPS